MTKQFADEMKTVYIEPLTKHTALITLLTNI